MSCLPCHEKQKQVYQRLSEVTGRIYVEYRLKGNHLITELNDFETLTEMGEIPKDTPYTVI